MIVEIKEKYKIVSAEEGMRITDHTGDDYINYSSWGSAIIGLNADYSSWYEITEAQDLENIDKQIEQLKALTDGE